eukprot:GHRR01008358.1.p1 GENE.GHRR01008358.1~~GHRR01008358.1.p1  ORF type:complete len:642 (+),score=132.76 GHRR01008358.1:338-2263(+)
MPRLVTARCCSQQLRAGVISVLLAAVLLVHDQANAQLLLGAGRVRPATAFGNSSEPTDSSSITATPAAGIASVGFSSVGPLSSMFPWANPPSPDSHKNDHYCRMDSDAKHNYCGLPYELSNFQGHFKCDKSVMVGRPADWQQAAQLVKGFSHVKAVGVGHSWWRQQFCSGNSSSAINIITTEFSSVLPASQGEPGHSIMVNETAMTAKVAAGVTQRTLLKYLDGYRTQQSPEGYTLAAFAWFIDQTMGGAVATGTHGSTFVYGSLSSQLKGLTILDAQGNIRTLDPITESHLWQAASISVGRLGIILDLTISIVKNLPVKRDKQDISPNEFVASIGQLQQNYNAAVGAGNALTSLAVWQAVKPWNEVQLLWFIPSRVLWKVSYTRIADPISDQNALQVIATDGPEGNQVLPGAYQQMEVQPAGTGPGIEVNPLYWSDLYRIYMATNVQPQTLPARQSYLSISELENRLHAAWNSYDQYEVAVPLSKAGDCLAAVQTELYGSSARWKGFRAPALVRFIRGEQIPNNLCSHANWHHCHLVLLSIRCHCCCKLPDPYSFKIHQQGMQIVLAICTAVTSIGTSWAFLVPAHERVPLILAHMDVGGTLSIASSYRFSCRRAQHTAEQVYLPPVHQRHMRHVQTHKA